MLLAGTKLRCTMLPGGFGSDERKLRCLAGDFIDGPTTLVQRGLRQVEMVEDWWPFGSAEPRKPSALKLRAALLGNELRLVAIWDGRHHSGASLCRGVEQLAKEKEIGRMLRQVVAELCP